MALAADLIGEEPIPELGVIAVSGVDRVSEIRLLEQENEVLRRAAAYLGKANLPKG